MGSAADHASGFRDRWHVPLDWVEGRGWGWRRYNVSSLKIANRHMRGAVGADPAAVHALGIERKCGIALRIQRDGATVAAGGGDFNEWRGFRMPRRAAPARIRLERQASRQRIYMDVEFL
ncbi:hypothetical protein ACU11_01505 [Xanthomonas oryzae pv. oryzicola]|nr:hypothetical protein ACU14_19475 [Xanthomonas oryzae pv. oryzicola]AKO18360.1 hypothetical protein ACU11_01505 [Xanthomonas oryzae pv. oryzicola]